MRETIHRLRLSGHELTTTPLNMQTYILDKLVKAGAPIRIKNHFAIPPTYELQGTIWKKEDPETADLIYEWRTRDWNQDSGEIVHDLQQH